MLGDPLVLDLSVLQPLYRRLQLVNPLLHLSVLALVSLFQFVAQLRLIQLSRLRVENLTGCGRVLLLHLVHGSHRLQQSL